MERLVFFTLDETCLMGKVRTPYGSTSYHHLTVATKAEMRAAALGVLDMHCLMRLDDVCNRVLNFHNQSFHFFHAGIKGDAQRRLSEVLLGGLGHGAAERLIRQGLSAPIWH